MILDRNNLSARTAFRSVRYRTTTRQGNTGTADLSASPFFRIKKHSMLQSTMEGTKAIQGKFNQTVRVKPINNEKISYIESFHSLMNPQQRPISQQRKFEILDFRKDSRMFFKNFQQLNDSQFTTLDEIKKPITFIKLKAHEAQKQLKKQSNEVQHLKLELDILKNSKMEQLQSIQKQYSDRIAIMRGAIRQNQINQQQLKLRTKRQVEGLQNSVQQMKQTFNKIHGKNLDMQSTIFNCQPFQLAQKQQFSQSYREAGDYF